MKKFLNIISPVLMVFLFIVAFTNTSFSQRNEKDKSRLREKLNTHKIAFLTDRIDLTEAEAEKFWPIYNVYEEEKKAIKEDKLVEALNADISEKEAEKALTSIMDLRSKELELDKKYLSKFRTVLSASKVVKLIKAEREFKAKMVGKLKNKPMKRER
ncbi:MAG: hypothetical protein IPL63_08665 [Saprospiraceae bacterium]|nr:hypothetical protein [Saprospiraceae bacterium]MBK6564192.1 hypothetical protein [Saprospiraceae bacterium]MBK6782352.1 hypothetical protein [Saprospiraceae bacterium]MBK8078890.1 hypothetical protein [Saprospiraceae bacterium]MBK8372180.1 hypothetical protein [Saprospiraceae bacterium]